MVNTKNDNLWLITGSLVFLAFVALGFVLYFTKVFLVPFVLAVFIVFLVSPLLDSLVLKWKFPRPIAVAISLLLVLVVIVFALGLLTTAVSSIVNTANQYSDNFDATSARMIEWLRVKGINIDLSTYTSELKQQIPVFLKSTFGPLMSATSWLSLTTIFVIFLLAGRNPGAVRQGVLGEIDGQVRYYIYLKVISSLITGLLIWAILSVLGLQLAGVFALLAFLLNFIPAVGSLISTMLPLPVAVAQFDSSAAIALAVILPGAVQVLIGNFLEPKFQGQAMKLHPVTIVLALSFWGMLWGVPGMLLAVPVTAMTRIVFMQVDILMPLGELMAGNISQLNGSVAAPVSSPKVSGETK
ncbi:MAG: AI-2E family transporter [Sedimentisphaerales bacterium]|nr:AI-2E family transporter [Sedimentisphaerales bacterium]MBN2841765.1 AI-2E family transporter [Sedimentisphaerales bacterium]